MKPGTRISFSFKGQVLKGVVLNVEAGKLVLKLDSGYNISAAPEELEAVKELQTEPKEKTRREQRTPNPSLPRIALLHTGGTIASRVDYSTGAVIAQYTADEVLDLYPELHAIANIDSKLLANMQSEMMRFAHWNIIAKAVEAAVKGGADGVIVTHGTDILAMTSAALAFALENLPVPVLLVGSQRSSDRPSSDAVTNLLCAAAFIAKEHASFKGVALCMHEGVRNDDCFILPACRTRKMHSSRRDAFKAINDRPYARIAYPGLAVEKLKNYPPSPKVGLVMKPFNEQLKIGLLHVHPQFFAEELTAYEGFDGLVVEVLGLGHMPTMKTDEHNAEHESVLGELVRLAQMMPVVAALQTIYGRIDMDVYSPGRQLVAAGVLGNGLDMIPETAFVKLAWLLSHHSIEETKKLYGESLRGELSPRSQEDGFRE